MIAERAAFVAHCDAVAVAHTAAWQARPVPLALPIVATFRAIVPSTYRPIDREQHAAQIGSAHGHALALRHSWLRATTYGQTLVAAAAAAAAATAAAEIAAAA